MSGFGVRYARKHPESVLGPVDRDLLQHRTARRYVFSVPEASPCAGGHPCLFLKLFEAATRGGYRFNDQDRPASQILAFAR
jgi:hypothetical protein